MHRLVSPEFIPDPEIERTFRSRRTNLKENSGIGVNLAEEEYSSEEDMADQAEPEVVLAEPDIIGIANDKGRSIRDYDVFDPNAMNTGIVRPEIIAAQFEFKPMMFQMLQTVGQFYGAATEDPHLHLKQFLEANSIATWNALAEEFLAKYFPAVKNAKMRNDITSFRQGDDETLFDV
ncbi:hypothetical protein L195_g012958 [Trifolium pratense]|uniref:Retrotransposon gag domain-containing protein n=1 Tax=Trifolium pratense TaxID=57577 RepID=A0A2K3PLS8_TRIPR|nr:hypothetical protein L195_g012958 [Trifolium pratense]